MFYSGKLLQNVDNLSKSFIIFSARLYSILVQDHIICHSSDSTAMVAAGIEPWTVAMLFTLHGSQMHEDSS